MRNNQGFTLVEMVISITIMSIVAMFSMQYLSRTAQMNQLITGQKALVDEGKIAMEFITREMRFAINTPTCGVGKVACVIGTGYPAITFDKYIESPVDPLRKDTNGSQIEYILNGTTLNRTSGAVTTTLATGVTAFTVTETSTNFYDVVLTMTGSQGQSFSLESAVKPINITG